MDDNGRSWIKFIKNYYVPISIGGPSGEGGLSQTEIQQLIDNSIAANTSPIPKVNGTPAGVLEGEMWIDTGVTPNKLMLWRNGAAEEVDTKNTEFQDLSGNTLTID